MENIVLITADSLRSDHCSTHHIESRQSTTPNLNSLGGTVFSNAYANGPVTAISIPSLLTGRYPLEDGHIAMDTKPSFVDHLQDLPYSTGLLTSNVQFQRIDYFDPFDTISTQTGIGDEGQGENPGPVIQLAKWGLRRGGTIGKLAAVARDTYHRFNGPIIPRDSDEELFNQASEWISTVKEPYFLWLHLMDTHYPFVFESEHFEHVSDFNYDPNRYARILERAMSHTRKGNFVWSLNPEQRQYLIDAYDASIYNYDQQVGEFIDRLNLNRTTVILSSDHGEELWDHGHFGHPGRNTIPRPMSLYEEVLSIPLQIVGTDVPERLVETPVSLVDVFPTVLDLAAIDIEPPRGESLLSIADRGTDANRQVIAHSTSPGGPNNYRRSKDGYRLGTIRKGDLKYIYLEGRDDELYDLANDPGERRNVLDDHPRKDSELREELLQTFGRITESELKTSPEVEDRLRELGYVD